MLPTKKQMNDILNSNDYGISEATGPAGILSKLWRTILMQLNIKPINFNTLLYQSSQQAKSKLSIKNNSIAKYFTIGNLRRELEKPQMTFKVFLKGIKLLRVYKVDIAIRLHHASGKNPITVHSISVDLGNVSVNIEDEDITSNYIGDEPADVIFDELDTGKTELSKSMFTKNLDPTGTNNENY